MRLVIDGRRLTAFRTGVGRYLESLLAEWALNSPPADETVVALHDSAGRDRVPRHPAIHPLPVGERLPGLLWERWGLGRVLRRGDLLFAPTNLVPASWSGRTVLVLFDLLQEVRPRDFPWRVRQRFGARYRRSARRADVVVVPSQATADDAHRFYGVERARLRVVYPAPEPCFRPLASDSAQVRAARSALGLGDDPYFLFVGKASKRRHLPEVLAAFELHRRKPARTRMVIAGPTDGRSAGSGEGVVAAGHVDEPILLGLLAGATALLYPSEYEGFGLPVVEAMACGCPVVTLRRAPLIEAGGEAAYYLEDATVETLARAMSDLAGDEGLRADLAASGLMHTSRWSRADFAGEVGRILAA